MRLQDLLALAARDMQVGNPDAAERKAREALKLAPDSPDALVLLAGIDERRGRSQQAGESFRRAAEQAPQRGDILNNYGAWLCQQGRPAESLSWFDRALQAPGYATPAESQANAGSCALDAGQLERAEGDLRAALSVLPGNPVALEAMAQLSFRRAASWRRGPSPNVGLRLHPQRVPCYNLRLKSKRGWVIGRHLIAIFSGFDRNFRRKRAPNSRVDAL